MWCGHPKDWRRKSFDHNTHKVMADESLHLCATDSDAEESELAQVTTDYLDRLRQMKARMTGIKTRVETVRPLPS